jgi:hypothetical protein
MQFVAFELAGIKLIAPISPSSIGSELIAQTVVYPSLMDENTHTGTVSSGWGPNLSMIHGEDDVIYDIVDDAEVHTDQTQSESSPTTNTLLQDNELRSC